MGKNGAITGTHWVMAVDPIVVVGGGLAAARLATEYRAAGGEASVTILSAEPDPPYNRPPLTKGFLRGEMDRDGPLVRPPDEYEDDVVELRLETTAERIDPDAHEVELAGGERVPYGTLVVATGARPRQLPLPGADLVGVHTYRTLRDAETVIQAAEDAHAAIVIGGSFIGAETAASLRTRGLEVTIVEMGETLMPQLRCPDLSAELVELYRSEGVEVLLETQLEELTGNGRLLTGARTADGRTIEGFLAIVGVGVVPNVELAQDAGADVEDGVVVDERFRTSLAGRVRDRRRRPVPGSDLGPHAADRALVERGRAGRAPRPPARRRERRLRRAARLLHAALRSQAPGARRRRAGCRSACFAARSPTAVSSAST